VHVPAHTHTHTHTHTQPPPVPGLCNCVPQRMKESGLGSAPPQFLFQGLDQGDRVVVLSAAETGIYLSSCPSFDPQTLE
jgi:hypothetical protein